MKYFDRSKALQLNEEFNTLQDIWESEIACYNLHPTDFTEATISKTAKEIKSLTKQINIIVPKLKHLNGNTYKQSLKFLKLYAKNILEITRTVDNQYKYIIYEDFNSNFNIYIWDITQDKCCHKSISPCLWIIHDMLPLETNFNFTF